MIDLKEWYDSFSFEQKTCTQVHEWDEPSHFTKLAWDHQQKKIDRLIAALVFYSNSDNWEQDVVMDRYGSVMTSDQGDEARDALKEIGWHT
jgi:hypothetical protein